MMVRLLNAADAQAFMMLRLDGITRFPEAFLLSKDEAQAARPDQTFRWLDSGDAYGAFDGDRMIGFAGMARRSLTMTRHRAAIGPFYVMPDHHGSGAAQALIDRMIEDATRKGILQLELWVWAGNDRAKAFYRRNGFVQRGTMPRAVIQKGVAKDDLFMVLALDA